MYYMYRELKIKIFIIDLNSMCDTHPVRIITKMAREVPPPEPLGSPLGASPCIHSIESVILASLGSRVSMVAITFFDYPSLSNWHYHPINSSHFIIINFLNYHNYYDSDSMATMLCHAVLSESHNY